MSELDSIRRQPGSRQLPAVNSGMVGTRPELPNPMPLQGTLPGPVPPSPRDHLIDTEAEAIEAAIARHPAGGRARALVDDPPGYIDAHTDDADDDGRWWTEGGDPLG